METISEKANNAAKAESKEFNFVEATLTDGTPIKVAKQTILDIMKDEIEKTAMQDGVFIMYHMNLDNYVRACKPDEWPAMEKSGEVADGVLLIEGGKMLVIAPTESPNALQWNTANISGGGYTTTDRMLAIEDWSGKANTEKQYTHVECQPVSTAVGYCKNYERVNKNQKGLTKGRWWLPSAGELIEMWTNRLKINYALSKIAGSSPLTTSWHWSSTEYSSTDAWILGFGSGTFNYSYGGKLSKGSVRAVSAFYL